jgi:hypothetical protein
MKRIKHQYEKVRQLRQLCALQELPPEDRNSIKCLYLKNLIQLALLLDIKDCEKLAIPNFDPGGLT